MSKEDKPLEYERRIHETKGVAQRLDLDYLKRPALLALLRARLTWGLIAASVLCSMPLVFGLGGSRRSLANGPVSPAHALFEDRCQTCHSVTFGSVPDRSCLPCHNEGPHPAKPMDIAKLESPPSCGSCHTEHRGQMPLAQVSNGNCTACHADLERHATGLHVKALSITAFRAGRHPEFAYASMTDSRPLRLNHSAHMPSQSREIRGIKLPMQCIDCHATDPTSPTGALIPVTFEKNCKSCHQRELQFDVYQVLGENAKPAPHTKDADLIRQIVWNTYRDALAADPSLARRPLGNDLNPQASADEWLKRVTTDSVNFLLGKKCNYCHVGDPMVMRAGRIAGHFPDGNPWLQRGEFSHHAHRAVTCESCHTAARTSTKTEDVLIPAMKSCLPCHGDSRAALDRCSKCHLYHNRTLEQDKTRRPTGELLGRVHGGRP
jgi:hypothetical protein